jgi:hypothetical protein
MAGLSLPVDGFTRHPLARGLPDATELVELLAFVALIAVAIWLSYRALRIRRRKDDSL